MPRWKSTNNRSRSARSSRRLWLPTNRNGVRMQSEKHYFGEGLPYQSLKGLKGKLIAIEGPDGVGRSRSEEHTSELQSRLHLVCRLLLEKKKTTNRTLDTRKSRIPQPACWWQSRSYRNHSRDRRWSAGRAERRAMPASRSPVERPHEH